MKRNHFLKSLLGTGAFFGLGGVNLSSSHPHQVFQKDPRFARGNMVGYSDNPIEKVKIAIIGMGNRGKSLIEMLDYLIENGKAEVVGLCDLIEKNNVKGLQHLQGLQNRIPETYFGSEEAWKAMVSKTDADLILICTPWNLHAEMSRYSMEQGKHVACEVPIASTLDDCWSLIETAERTKRHCIMIENCCYNAEELWILNMVQEGVFGELTHAECAYLHDLRALMFDDKYYQDQWRIKHHINRDGNFYTTHGLGPISNYMGIGRGDSYKYLVSMSSREAAMSEASLKLGSKFKRFKQGDVNTTLIKTEMGRSIMLQFDVHTGRPYSRINQLVGTKAVHEGYPSRLYIDGEELVFWGHQWLSEEDYQSYSKKYEHPLISRMKNISENFKQGHGGMDFIMIYRLIHCLNRGVPLDLNVYDGVMWSAVTPLTEMSVASDGAPIQFPDFTGGTWSKKRELEIMRDLETK